MRKSLLAVSLAAAMVAGVFSALPVSAETVVPAEPLIVDPVGDANYLNDQGFAGTGLTGTPAVVPEFGDNPTPRDGGSVSDVMAAWLTADADNVYAHFQTEAAGPATLALFYRLRVDPGVGSRCLWFQAGATGAGNAQSVAKPSLRTVAPCDPVQTVSEGAEFIQEGGPDGTGIHTIKIPRALSAYLVDGATLASPKVDVTHYTLGPPVPGVTSGSSVTAPTIDQTKPGIDWVIASGPGSTPPQVEPPADPPPPDDPPVKKGCKKKKGKGKKKGCDKGKGPKEEPKPGCEPYVPGEQGAEAETLKVTDAATEEEPVSVEFPGGTGAAGPVLGLPVPPDQTTSTYHNVQIDSDSPEVGLYVRLEFAERRDYDLYLRYSDGTEATHSGDFNGAAEVLSCGGAGTGCSSGSNFEQVNGIKTSDCQGWTTESVAYLTEGGDVTLSFWLGEATTDPAPPA